MLIVPRGTLLLLSVNVTLSKNTLHLVTRFFKICIKIDIFFCPKIT